MSERGGNVEKELREKINYLEELSKKKLTSFTQRLAKYDRWRRLRSSIENATNWMLAINTGTLFFLVGSFGRFIVSDVMPNKPLFLVSAFLLGFSLVLLALFRAILYLRGFLSNKALEDIEGLPDRVHLNIERKTKEELKDLMERISKRSSGYLGFRSQLDTSFSSSNHICVGIICLGSTIASHIYCNFYCKVCMTILSDF